MNINSSISFRWGVIQVLRHPRLRADGHRFIGLSFVNEGTVFNRTTA